MTNPTPQSREERFISVNYLGDAYAIVDLLTGKAAYPYQDNVAECSLLDGKYELDGTIDDEGGLIRKAVNEYLDEHQDSQLVSDVAEVIENNFHFVQYEDRAETYQVILSFVDLIEREKAQARAEGELGKDQAYWERNQLVAALSKLFESHLMLHPIDDMSWEHDWRNIVCIHLPSGQATWHINDSDLSTFQHLVEREKREGAIANHWDGHTTEEKYTRLAKIDHLITQYQDGEKETQ